MKIVARMKTSQRHAAKRALLRRDGRKCWLCGGHMADHELSIDHIIPRSKGGGNCIENLKLAHIDCNTRRQDADGIAYERAA
jgi:5-methylcytosine-specific restriction endonuclease McrA